MKHRAIAASFAASLAAASLPEAHAARTTEVTARVTYYCPGEAGSRRTSTGTRPAEGVTVAVDPRDIPYGSTVEIPGLAGIVGDGRFRAADTGSAVKSRKAARLQGRNVPVVDVFLSSRARVDEVTKLLGRDGHFMRCMIVAEPKRAGRARA